MGGGGQDSDSFLEDRLVVGEAGSGTPLLWQRAMAVPLCLEELLLPSETVCGGPPSPFPVGGQKNGVLKMNLSAYLFYFGSLTILIRR